MRKLHLFLLITVLMSAVLLRTVSLWWPPDIVEASTTQTFNASGYSCYLESGDAVYATAHDSATADTLHYGTTYHLDVGQKGVVGGLGTYYIYRGGFYFDTSALPDDAVISAAHLELYVTTDYSITDDFDLVACNTTGMVAPPVVADYHDLLSSVTSFGTLATTGITEHAYNTLTLNAIGISTINTSGYTIIGLRSSNDISSFAPGVWPAQEYIEFGSPTSYGYVAQRLVLTYTSSPTINTTAATSVTMSTARLNSLVTNDGGESCYVRFQYGLTAAYGIDTPWVSGYTTSSTPYITVSALSENTTYHFRAQIYNTVNGIGSPDNGVDLTFTTGSSTGGGGGVAFGRPLNLTAVPVSSTSVLLNWQKGSLAYFTKIQYSTSDFPTNYNSGTTAYFDEYSSTVLDDLIAGTTYYFSAWSYTPADNTTGIDYWSDYEPTTLDYILDAPLTSTTVCSDNALLFTDEQYYRGCYAMNITAGSEERLITDYDGATYSCTLLSAIAGQVATNQWYVRLRCDAVCTTPGSTDDWVMPDDSDSFNEPVTTKLTNFPMHEVVQMWATVSGMSYADSWVFWGMITATAIGIAVALISESALLTIISVIVIIAGGYFLGVFALWIAIMYIVLSVPLGWALAKW